MYKRTLIRQFLVSYLKANTTLFNNERVYGGRVAPMIESEIIYPYVVIFTDDESIVEHTTMHTSRELDIQIGVIAKDNTIEDLSSIIEAVLFDVEKAMSKLLGASAVGTDPYDLIEDIYLDAIITTNESDSQSNISKAMMSFKVSYYYQRPVAFDYSEMDDFDELGSVANMIITNEGVPSNV
tara:strand:- start:8668 stop:9213 length:546 start_codon:yes stop_codon:yes gene_type:complete